MSKAFFISPTEIQSGLTSVTFGLVHSLQKIGVSVGVYQPISDTQVKNDNSQHFAKLFNKEMPVQSISLHEAQSFLSEGKSGLLMERVVENYQAVASSVDVVVVEGIPPHRDQPYITRLNIDIARNLDAQVILVCSKPYDDKPALNKHLKVAASLFADSEDPDVLGVVLNKLKVPAEISTEQDLVTWQTEIVKELETLPIFTSNFHLIGAVPYQRDLAAPRVSDLCHTIDLRVINFGEAETRRVHEIVFAAKTIDNIVPRLKAGALIVTPSDRSDVIVAACMGSLSGIPLAAIMITGDSDIDENVYELCAPAFRAGLPLLQTSLDTFASASTLANLNTEVQQNDTVRMDHVVSSVSEFLDLPWLETLCEKERKSRLSPPAFRHLISVRAKAAKKTIVLPEGNEPRTVAAAIACQQRTLANCVLIGKRDEIEGVAQAQGLALPDLLRIIDPDEVRERYVAPMVELRKHKGLAPDMALSLLEDNVMLATMMVALDEVDGLVSGAVHTTANTVRPALQLIKTRPGAKVVSSVFFMCLPEQVLVYGDCAINPDPNADELADIAIQSADSAIAFGIQARVAMISYSTGTSGTGADVDKVKEATRLAKERRPDLEIDGPLQYDAAAIESVAAKKAPNSTVAGKATVFIFPDLNTGNTTYKAVQRSANVISIGPMLQGLKKPVNDLSRGALIDDIIYTIALTAIQAQQVEDAKK